MTRTIALIALIALACTSPHHPATTAPARADDSPAALWPWPTNAQDAAYYAEEAGTDTNSPKFAPAMQMAEYHLAHAALYDDPAPRMGRNAAAMQHYVRALAYGNLSRGEYAEDSQRLNQIITREIAEIRRGGAQ